jgi:hypothetical protein
MLHTFLHKFVHEFMRNFKHPRYIQVMFTSVSLEMTVGGECARRTLSSTPPLCSYVMHSCCFVPIRFML